jgi:acyl-CoA reductase-like NAD-dependent aldehyde dehydrogenase
MAAVQGFPSDSKNANSTANGLDHEHGHGHGYALPYRADLLLGGKSIGSVSGACFNRTSPLSGDIVTIASAATIDDVDRAALSAAAAFPDWSNTQPSVRKALLEKSAELLIRHKDMFIPVMMAETGATRQWCEFNVDYGAKILIDAASMTQHMVEAPLPDPLPETYSVSIRQPAGVCLAIAPWNAPILLAVRSIALALACGNTVILKTSELCPATQRLLGDVFHQVGLPDGVLNIISNAPADASLIVETLIAHPVVRRVNFTGSTRVGRIIAQIAARHLKRCLLELGGKAPMIVLDDANLDEAAKAAAFGAFFNQGQVCMSTERVIVLDAVADTFMTLFVEKARALTAADPMAETRPLGALISADSGRRIAAMIDDAVTKGAKVVVGGQVHDALMDATVIDHVSPTMRLYREESFGPLVSIVRVADAEEAITVANDCEYGLSGAVFSRNVPKAMAVARRVETGILHINSATVEDHPHMPFGGVKASGYGRFGGEAALDEFTELRWMTVSSGTKHYPI